MEQRDMGLLDGEEMQMRSTTDRRTQRWESKTKEEGLDRGGWQQEMATAGVDGNWRKEKQSVMRNHAGKKIMAGDDRNFLPFWDRRVSAAANKTSKR
jgi:hypothetical protein